MLWAGKERLARPERFELPTSWFVGRFDWARGFIIQSLAALAKSANGPAMAHCWHSQYESVATRNIVRSATRIPDNSPTSASEMAAYLGAAGPRTFPVGH